MKNTGSPTSYIPQPKAVKMSRTPFYIGGGIVFVLALVFLWGFFNQGGPKGTDAQEQEIVENKNEKPLVTGENLQGVALPPSSEGVASLPSQDTTKPIVVVTAPKEDETLKREQDQLRRHRLQAQIGALSSPLVIKKAPSSSSGKSPENYQQPGQERTAREFTDDRYRETQYDAEADKDKEAFFSRSDSMDADWLSPHVRTTGQRFEVKTGSVIPSTMITGVNSDLPGALIGQVSQNVYDTGTGRYLLIPQGTKVYGVYDSRVVYGQERVLVAWNRLIYPDGSAITLGAMPGSDMGGSAGFSDEVNNHYMRIFGSAFMMSLISGGMAYTMDSLDSGGSGDDVSMQDEMTSALAAQLGQTTTTLLQKNLNIKPTLEIRPGYQFNVVITKDLVFDAPYTPRQGG